MHTDVTVIVGCYKQEKYIDQALYAADNQIIPYGESKDAVMPTFTVMESHDSCFTGGHGASAHRNRAIADCDSDWIIWLDADDLIPSNYLYEMWTEYWYNKAIYAELYPLVHSSVQFTSGCRMDVFRALSLSDSEGVEIVTRKGSIICERLYPMGMSAMFSKESWKDVGGFDERIRRVDDLDFWIRIRQLGGSLLHAADTHLLRRNIKSVEVQKEIDAKFEYDKSLELFEEKHGIRLATACIPYRIPSTGIL